MDSVLAQTFPAGDMEIIVADDGSTDRTPEIIQRYVRENGSRIRYLRKENGGQASVFNAAIPECRGEILTFLDGDDWYAPEKLAVYADVFQSRPEIGALGHGQFEVYSDGRPMGRVGPAQETVVHLKDLSGAKLFTQLRAFLGTSRLGVRRELLGRILPVPADLVIEADEYMFTLIPALAPALILDKPLFYYRFHDDNLFQFSEYDEAKARRKAKVLATLARQLPPALRNAGVREDVIEVVMRLVRIDSSRERLALDGGWSWETFQTERAAYRNAYAETSLGYRVFKNIILAASLAVPPRTFYRFKRWYAANRLHRYRNLLGKPVEAGSIVEQRPEAP